MIYIKAMKRIFFFLGLIIACGCSQAQNNTATKALPPPNIQHIPAYRILTKDSTYLTSANLKKGQPVMIIYFSPDCSHCQHLMYEMKPEMKSFKDIQIVMITFIPTNMLKMLKEFYVDFNLAAYPNISMGTEYPNYIIQRYYQVATTPYIAIYDHKGKLVQAFAKAPKMDELIAAVKKA
jgi:thioredoxin-related protein